MVFSAESSAIVGIGGGNIIVPILVFFNVKMQKATATTSALGLPIAMMGTLSYVLAGLDTEYGGYTTLGYVYLPAACAIAFAAYFVAPLGVSIAHKLPAQTLKRLFGALLLIVAARMFLQSF